VSAEVGGNTAFGVGVLNVDVTIQAGNPAAVGISNDAAQGGALRAMRFTLAPDALAGVFTPGWAHVSGMIRHTPPPPFFAPPLPCGLWRGRGCGAVGYRAWQ
jgi:hypothetical protein